MPVTTWQNGTYRGSTSLEVIAGVSTADGTTIIPVAVDPATGQLQTSGSGGGVYNNSSVGTNTSTAPASSTEIGYVDNSGKLQGVSPSTPLPINNANGTTLTNQNTQVTLLSEIENQLVASTTQVYTDGLSADQIGAVKSFTWSGGLLSTITRNGRTKTFTWNSDGTLQKITIS